MQRTWEELRDHYKEASEYMPQAFDVHQAMVGLCDWVCKESLSGSIFGNSSHHILIIAQTKFEWPACSSLQVLKITPKFDTSELEFRFIDTHLESRQWLRLEPADSEYLIKRLQSFMKQTGWI